jgi:hypothetical protein
VIDKTIDLVRLVPDVAIAFSRADARQTVWVSQRSGRAYQPGIGPHAENAAVELMLTELAETPSGDIACGQFLPYPNATRQKCDLWIGEPLQWAIEVKMARFQGAMRRSKLPPRTLGRASASWS